MRVSSRHVSRRLAAFALFALTLPASGAEIAVPPPPQGTTTLKQALARAGSSDVVWLARGGVYRETGLDFGSCTVKAAGPAELPPPIITAAQVVPGLKPWAKNARVLTAKVEVPVKEVYVDGAFVPLARWPNQGWAHAGKGSTPEALVDPDRAKLGGTARWTGAQVRWRRWSWWWETRPVENDDGTRLSLGKDGRFQDDFTGIGSAYCVDNTLAELDAPGEWFWEASSKTLYVFPPEGSDPQAMVVEAVPDSPQHQIGSGTLDGIGFARTASRTVLSVNGKATIANCLFQDIGNDAVVTAWNCAGAKVVGCTFRDVRDRGIQWNEDPKAGGGSLIERNTFERIGHQPGYGGSGSWHATGVIVYNAKPVTIRLNRFMDVGYCGIIVKTDSNIIERNILVRCMSQLNDGSAILVCANHNTVRDNVMLDTVGNLETSHPWYPISHGIWVEFLGDFHDNHLIGNTAAYSGGNGLFLPNNRTTEVRDNVFFGNRTGGLRLGGHEEDKGPQRHTVAGNVLVATDPPRLIERPANIPGDWGGHGQRCLDFEPGIDYGTLSGTTMVAAPGSGVVRGGNQRYEDAAAWKQACRWADPEPRVQKAHALLLINDTEQEHAFDPPSGWSDLAGKSAGKAVTVAPFRSAVLIRSGDGAGIPPFLTASGIDYRGASFSGATAKADGKPRREVREAAKPEPSFASVKPKPDAWKRWVAQLRDRSASLASGRKPPRFNYAALRGVVTIRSVQGDSATLVMGDDGGEISARLFATITPMDALSLAQDCLRRDQPEEHAMVAFFARCADDAVAFHKHASHAGALTAEIDASFEQ